MWGGPGSGLGLVAIYLVDTALGIKPEDMGDVDLDQRVGWPGTGLGLFAIYHVDTALGIKHKDMGDVDLDQGVGWAWGGFGAGRNISC